MTIVIFIAIFFVLFAFFKRINNNKTNRKMTDYSPNSPMKESEEQKKRSWKNTGHGLTRNELKPLHRQRFLSRILFQMTMN